MKLPLNILIILGTIIYSSNALSLGSSDKSKNSEYHLAIKGGVSLGSYEAGINRTILRYISEQKSINNNSELVSFSGASAGSLNSILSAIDLCIIDKTIKVKSTNNEVITLDDSLKNNFMRYGWDVGISNLLPAEGNTNRYESLYELDEKKKNASDFSVFSRNAFNEKKKIIKELITRKATNNCKLTVTMSVTKFNPLKYEVKGIGETVHLQRFVVPLDISVVNGRLIFKNSNLKLFKRMGEETIPSEYLRLVEGKDGVVDFEDVWDLAMASSAFPVAFHPVELKVCYLHNLKGRKCQDGEASSELFSDGGLFDNSPIGAAYDIIENNNCTHQKNTTNSKCNYKNDTKLIFINPDSYRTKTNDKSKVNNKKIIGLNEYIGYFSDSFLKTAHEEIYKDALSKVLSKKNSISYIMTSRYHNLLADFHAHFGAFYAKEFREHDYLVGVYDGENVLAQLRCDSKYKSVNKFSTKYISCVRKNVLNRINVLSSNNFIDIDFIIFLYNSEYKKSLSYKNDKADDEDIYIALAKSFEMLNKNNGDSIDYKKYIANLRRNTINIKISNYADLDKILNNGATYTTKILSKMYENILQIHDLSNNCESCRPIDSSDYLGNILKMSETIVDPFLYHFDHKVWPKPLKSYYGFSYGFNAFQKNQVYSLDIRPRFKWLADKELSVDVNLNYHDFGDFLASDDYYSYSLSLVKHNNNILFNTTGFGIQQEYFKTTDSHKVLGSVFIKFGIMNEIFALKIAHRLKDDAVYPPGTIDGNSYVLSVDVTRAYQMLTR